MAQDYYPLTKKGVESKGWEWSEYEEKANQNDGSIKLPDNINDVSEDICDKILTCKESGKQYKIIPQELKFYKKQNIPLPRKSPHQRHLDCDDLRNPRALWERKCDKCNKEIQTTYSPDRPEKVLCEECYLKEVY